MFLVKAYSAQKQCSFSYLSLFDIYCKIAIVNNPDLTGGAK